MKFVMNLGSYPTVEHPTERLLSRDLFPERTKMGEVSLGFQQEVPIEKFGPLFLIKGREIFSRIEIMWCEKHGPLCSGSYFPKTNESLGESHRAIRWIQNVYLDGQFSGGVLRFKNSPDIRQFYPLIVLGLQQISLPVHQFGLRSHQSGLPFDSKTRTMGNDNANDADAYQDETKEPRPPIENIVDEPSILVRYGHNRDPREFYAVLGILGCYLASIGIGGWGGCRYLDGHRWSGGFIFAIAILLDIFATGFGGSGCLPWQWWDCLHHKKDSHKYSPHGETVSQKVLTQSLSMLANCIMSGTEEWCRPGRDPLAKLRLMGLSESVHVGNPAYVLKSDLGRIREIIRGLLLGHCEVSQWSLPQATFVAENISSEQRLPRRSIGAFRLFVDIVIDRFGCHKQGISFYRQFRVWCIQAVNNKATVAMHVQRRALARISKSFVSVDFIWSRRESLVRPRKVLNDNVGSFVRLKQAGAGADGLVVLGLGGFSRSIQFFNALLHRGGNYFGGGYNLVGLLPGLIHFLPLHASENNYTNSQGNYSYIRPFRFFSVGIAPPISRPTYSFAKKVFWWCLLILGCQLGGFIFYVGLAWLDKIGFWFGIVACLVGVLIVWGFLSLLSTHYDALMNKNVSQKILTSHTCRITLTTWQTYSAQTSRSGSSEHCAKVPAFAQSNA